MDEYNPICPRDNGIVVRFQQAEIYDEQSAKYTLLELWVCGVCGTIIGRFVEE